MVEVVVVVVVVVQLSGQMHEGRGFGPEIQNQAVMALFWAAIGLQGVGGCPVVSQDHPPRYPGWWGVGDKAVWYGERGGGSYLVTLHPSCFTFSSLPTPPSTHS